MNLWLVVDDNLKLNGVFFMHSFCSQAAVVTPFANSGVGEDGRYFEAKYIGRNLTIVFMHYLPQTSHLKSPCCSSFGSQRAAEQASRSFTRTLADSSLLLACCLLCNPGHCFAGRGDSLNAD